MKTKKIKFYCTGCDWPYELEPEKCNIFDMNRTTFLGRKTITLAISYCPKCNSRNVEQVRSKKYEKNSD